MNVLYDITGNGPYYQLIYEIGVDLLLGSPIYRNNCPKQNLFGFMLLKHLVKGSRTFTWKGFVPVGGRFTIYFGYPSCSRKD